MLSYLILYYNNITFSVSVFFSLYFTYISHILVAIQHVTCSGFFFIVKSDIFLQYFYSFLLQVQVIVTSVMLDIPDN